MLRFLFKRLTPFAFASAAVSQLTTVVRYEVEIAKREFQEKLRGLLQGAIAILFAIGLSLIAITLFVAAAVVALNQVWPAWLSALVVGGVILVIAFVLAMLGSRKIRANSDLRPERLTSLMARFSGKS